MVRRNEKTVSFEPYFQPTLAAGAPRAWEIAYDFDAVLAAAAKL